MNDYLQLVRRPRARPPWVSAKGERAVARPTHLAWVKLLGCLYHGAHTIAELSEECGVTRASIQLFLIALWREELVFVTSWQKNGAGRYTVPVFKYGEGRDAPKPKKSRKDIVRDTRSRQKTMKLNEALFERRVA